MVSTHFFYFFFFQAEDGIRDLIVTGVQTCALPISFTAVVLAGSFFAPTLQGRGWVQETFGSSLSLLGSGEGRVGEKGRSRGWPDHLKKKKKKKDAKK